MASKDRTKTDATSSETAKAKPEAGEKETRSKKPLTKGEPTVSEDISATAPKKPERPSKPLAAGRPTTVSAAADADHRSIPAGIDAMAILEKAETEPRSDIPSRERRREPGEHVSAAEAIARAVVRDHPDTSIVPQPTEPTGSKGAPKPGKAPQPRLAPKAPIPAEPEDTIGGVGAEGLPPPLVDSEEIEALLNAEHGEPFAFLGMHLLESKAAVLVRTFQPDARGVSVVDAASGKVVADLKKAHDEGLFVGEILGRKKVFPYRLRVTTVDGDTEIDDPYRFPPLISSEEMTLLNKGEHLSSYEVLGAHPAELDAVTGIRFAVWAPNACHVAVVGDFNNWDGRRHGMRLRPESGVWEIFLPGVSPGALYKYEVKGTRGGVPQMKSDPYAFYSEHPPGSASVVQDILAFSWRDGGWMKSRKKRHGTKAPIAFYEVHLGSWRRDPAQADRWLTYRELADQLVKYVSDLGFTHIALLPISEHTYDDTVGYLPSSLYAPTSRFGTPDDFRYLVDACHRAQLGVIADWVPNYLSEEPQGLTAFDGTPLYERPDHHSARDPDWNLPMYDLGRPQVVNYLLANVRYWLDQFHLDGLRIDSLAKLLYLDYGRADGEWSPNEEGGNDNLEALAFMRRLNNQVTKKHSGTMMIAEDSSLRSGVTTPLKDGGLGFAYRWNSAWAYDTLRYLSRHPVHRKYYQFELTNPLLYAFEEDFVLTVSHDHVSIGQGALINKIPGDRWQKFATLRAWYALMYALPGKKLMFMGSEFAQDREWNSNISLDWHLLENPMHLGVQRLVRDLNALYQERPALHESDSDSGAFQWIDFADEDSSVVAFIRYCEDRKKHMVVVTHFTPVVRSDYRIGVPVGGRYTEILNTDAEAYGGGNAGSAGGVTAEPEPCHGQEYSVCLTLPPYATVMLEPDNDRGA